MLDPQPRPAARSRLQLTFLQGYGEFMTWRACFDYYEATGKEEVKAFLRRKWAREHEYRLRKSYWSHSGNRIAVRFEYEWHDDDGQWYRSYGNENWEFDENGLMAKRFASINDLPIDEADRHLK